MNKETVQFLPYVPSKTLDNTFGAIVLILTFQSAYENCHEILLIQKYEDSMYFARLFMEYGLSYLYISDYLAACNE